MCDTAFVHLYVGLKCILITELIALLMYSKWNENQKCKELQFRMQNVFSDTPSNDTLLRCICNEILHCFFDEKCKN